MGRLRRTTARSWQATIPGEATTARRASTDDVGAAARHYKDGFDQSQDPLIRGIRDGLAGVVDGVGHAATNAVDSVGRKISGWRRNADADE